MAHTLQCPGHAGPCTSQASIYFCLCPFLSAAPTGEDLPLLPGAVGFWGPTKGKDREEAQWLQGQLGSEEDPAQPSLSSVSSAGPLHSPCSSRNAGCPGRV